MGRFISADGILGANQDLLAYNLYAYVSNNPVNLSDPMGNVAIGATVSYLPVRTVIRKQKTTVSSAISSSSQSKNLKINGASLPTVGVPNSRVKQPGPNGGQVRNYGPDGKAVRDFDYEHKNHHPDLPSPHQHDWDWSKEKPRQPAKEPDVELPSISLGGSLYTGTFSI